MIASFSLRFLYTANLMMILQEPGSSDKMKCFQISDIWTSLQKPKIVYVCSSF